MYLRVVKKPDGNKLVEISDWKQTDMFLWILYSLGLRNLPHIPGVKILILSKGNTTSDGCVEEFFVIIDCDRERMWNLSNPDELAAAQIVDKELGNYCGQELGN